MSVIQELKQEIDTKRAQLQETGQLLYGLKPQQIPKLWQIRLDLLNNFPWHLPGGRNSHKFNSLIEMQWEGTVSDGIIATWEKVGQPDVGRDLASKFSPRLSNMKVTDFYSDVDTALVEAGFSEQLLEDCANNTTEDHSNAFAEILLERYDDQTRAKMLYSAYALLRKLGYKSYELTA